MENQGDSGTRSQTLGEYLKALRTGRYSLRDVEEGTEVSNAYLSQLENDKITKPSPHILHSLATFYGVSYEILMEKAGYIKKQVDGEQGAPRSGRLAASSLGQLSRGEEEQLLQYLAFIRSQRRKELTRPDDFTVSERDYAEIRKHADRLLRDANAYGNFPTPIEAIIDTARLSVEREVSLDQGFLKRVYGKVASGVAKAVDKVLGLFDSRDRRIYLDRSVLEEKQRFVSLHETGHGYLPWQKDLYAFMEDGETNLDPYVEQEFERQASVFASEVLFQLDRFQEDARSMSFEMRTPMKLAKRYGASLYATIRRFVTASQYACAVIVFEQPQYIVGRGNEFRVRRVISSPSFSARFGKAIWPSVMYGEEDHLAKKLPLSRFNRKFTKRCRIDSPVEGIQERFYLEAFDSTYHVFALVFPESELKTMQVAV